MGAQIALQAALHGVGVDLVDISPDALDKGRRQIEGLARRNVGKGRQTAEEAAATLARLTFSSDMDTAAPRCDWAIEAVVERLDVKQAVFNQLAKLLPAHAGIATNSSHIRVATIVGDADHRPRALNMHFFHPVVVMDLVEIVASPHTDEAILREAAAWADRIGRSAVVLRKDVDGFLVNRILGRPRGRRSRCSPTASARSTRSTWPSSAACGGRSARSSSPTSPASTSCSTPGRPASRPTATRVTARPSRSSDPWSRPVGSGASPAQGSTTTRSTRLPRSRSTHGDPDFPSRGARRHR